MSDIKPTCTTCDYFSFFAEDDDQVPVGVCMRYAPRPVTINEVDLQGRKAEQFIPWASWPRVFGDKCCGDHSMYEWRRRITNE